MANKTMGIWTAKDAIFADDINENAAHIQFLNNHQVLRFPDPADYRVYFRGIIPRFYSGQSITVQLHITNENGTGDTIWYGALQRHNLNDPLVTNSYGTEADGLATSSASANYVIRETGGMDFTTAAYRDNLAAGDMFTLRIRRDGTFGGDDLGVTAYLFTVHMYEVYS